VWLQSSNHIQAIRQRYRLQNELPDGGIGADLKNLSAKELEQYATGTYHLLFYGPQLVTEAIPASPRLVLLGEPGSGQRTALGYLALTLAHAGLDAPLDLAAQLEGWRTFGDQARLIPLFMPLLPLARRLAMQPGRNGTAVDLWTAIDAHL